MCHHEPVLCKTFVWSIYTIYDCTSNPFPSTTYAAFLTASLNKPKADINAGLELIQAKLKMSYFI